MTKNQPSRPLLIRGAKQLLTLRGPKEPRRGAALRDLGIIPDGAVLTKDGIIQEAGPRSRVENLAIARGAEPIDASGRVVMPGFVDCHTHLVCGPPWLRQYDDPAEGTQTQAAAIRGWAQSIRSETAGRLEARARRILHDMARHGTTTLEAKTGYGLDAAGELKMLRVLRALDRDPLDVVPTLLVRPRILREFHRDPWKQVEWIGSELLPLVWRRKLAAFAHLDCDDPDFEPHRAAQFLETARDHGFAIKLDADQFSRSGAVELAVRLGAISVDHLEHTELRDVTWLAAAPTIATLLPGSILHGKRAHYAPARPLIDAGAAVALATNFNPWTCPTYSMQMVAALACSQMEMTPAEAISAATINAAHAIGRSARVGSLEPGKAADILILDSSDYREIPYHFGVNQVAMTIKNGAILYEEGPLIQEGGSVW